MELITSLLSSVIIISLVGSIVSVSLSQISPIKRFSDHVVRSAKKAALMASSSSIHDVPSKKKI